MGKIILTFTCPKCGAVFGWEVDHETYVEAIEKDKLMEMIGPQNLSMIGGDIKVRKAVDFMYENAVKK